jgi:hypothetical protein
MLESPGDRIEIAAQLRFGSMSHQYDIVVTIGRGLGAGVAAYKQSVKRPSYTARRRAAMSARFRRPGDYPRFTF